MLEHRVLFGLKHSLQYSTDSLAEVRIELEICIHTYTQASSDSRALTRAQTYFRESVTCNELIGERFFNRKMFFLSLHFQVLTSSCSLNFNVEVYCSIRKDSA